MGYGHDGCGRTIGTVLLPNDTNLNHELVKAGMGWWYRKDAPDNETLKNLEAEARVAKRGLWVDPNPLPPWEWWGTRQRCQEWCTNCLNDCDGYTMINRVLTTCS